MTLALRIARRELYSYLRSPLGPTTLAGALLLEGILFYWFGLTKELLSAEVLEKFFWAASGTTMVAALILSMRLLAEERQTGTFILLNTSPVSGRDIVLGKFLSVVVLLALMTGLSLYMPLLIFVNGKVSIGHILVGYVGLVLLGSATAAIGLLGSALARSQVVALVVSASILAVLILMWAVAEAVPPPLNVLVSGLAFHHENFRPFMAGTLELARVAYYAMTTYFFLLAAVKTLEARRWR